jgi:hypothetical protein
VVQQWQITTRGEHPVRVIEQRRRDRPNNPVCVRPGNRKHNGDYGKEYDQGWQQAASAPLVEGHEVDLAGAFALFEQQRRDEEAGEYEEQGHSDRGCGMQARDLRVTQEHESDRDASQTIKRWPIAKAPPLIRRRRSRHQASPRLTATVLT